MYSTSLSLGDGYITWRNGSNRLIQWHGHESCLEHMKSWRSESNAKWSTNNLPANHNALPDALKKENNLRHIYVNKITLLPVVEW
jgi:hypothetical protein